MTPVMIDPYDVHNLFQEVTYEELQLVTPMSATVSAKSFPQWTNDDAKLLLNIALDHMTEKMSEYLD
jgi:hypothetical protein